jgi:hypothetical protein
MNLTESVKEIQRLSVSLKDSGHGPQPVQIVYTSNLDRDFAKPIPGPIWVWRVDIGFLVSDPPNRNGFEGLRVFSAETIEEAMDAAIVALQKGLNEKIKAKRKELEKLETELSKK